MKRLLPALAAIVIAAGFFWTSAAPATAHPVDELVQQIYITPTATGIDLGVELEPGILVGPDFVTTLDVDGDGVVSDTEAAANAAAVQNAIAVTVDGRPAAITLVRTIYPDANVLAAAGGSIALLFTIDAAFTDGPTAITVTNDYQPLTPADQLFATTIQTNLTPAIDTPITVAAMQHDDLGRTFTATYTLAPVDSAAGAAAPAPEGATPAPGSIIATVSTLIVTLTVALVAAAAYAWRRARRTKRPSVVGPASSSGPPEAQRRLSVIPAGSQPGTGV